MRLPDPSNTRVVLIGTNSYTSPELSDVPAIANNVGGMAKLLTSPDGSRIPPANVTVVPQHADQRLVGKMLLRAARDAEDLLLVYYAGHGLLSQRRHELFLTLADTEPDELAFSALNFEAVRDACLDSTATSRVVILDCCYAGRAIGATLSTSDAEIMGQLNVRGTYTLTSAPANRTALVLPDEKYTAFTGRLIRLLTDGIPDGPALLTLGAIYKRLRATLAAEGLPTPQQCGTETADQLALVVNRAQAPRSTPTHRSSVLQRFEKRLEYLTDGDFGTVFNGVVHPVEILNAMQREADAHKAILADRRTLVPNRYVIDLSPYDHSRLAPYAAALAQELAQSQAEFIGEQSWTVYGDIIVEIERGDGLDTGMFRVTVEVVAGTGYPVREVRLASVDGRTYPLSIGSTIIGRGDQADLRLPDGGVSRRHARLDFDGTDVVLADLGSATGTMVNGRRVSAVALHPGDVIQVGATTLRVSIP